MKFLALLTLHSDTVSKKAFSEFYEGRGGKEGKWDVPEGVKILDGLRLYGRYDVAIIYEAPDEETGKAFMSEMWPYADIERFLTASCPWCENLKH